MQGNNKDSVVSEEEFIYVLYGQFDSQYSVGETSLYSKHECLSSLIPTSAFKAIILMFAISTFIRFQIRLLGNQDSKLAVLVVVAV